MQYANKRSRYYFNCSDVIKNTAYDHAFMFKNEKEKYGKKFRFIDRGKYFLRIILLNLNLKRKQIIPPESPIKML